MSRLDEDDEKLEEKIDELLDVVKKKGRRGIAKVVYGRAFTTVLLLLIQIAVLYYSVLKYERYSAYYYFGFLIISVIVVFAIINEEINPMYKLAWIIPVVAVPIFGTITYLFVRFQPGPMLMRKKLDGLNKKMLPLLRQDEDVKKSLEMDNKDAFNTARYLNATLNYPVYDNSDVEYFPVGEKMFRKMLLQLQKAENFIFLEYFIIEEGIMWDAILEILKKKARKGVEVRIMYDGTCCFKLLPHSYPKTLEKLGIKAKVFSPPVPILSMHQNNRDHRKIMVIDGKVAFTGGINLADEYINEVEKFGHWKDTGIMLKGEAVKTFTCMFLQMWNLNSKSPDTSYERFIKKSSYGKKGYVIPYGDSPLDKENTGEQVYFDIINQAKDYVYIMTPYLIVDNEMMMALKGAAKRGVDIRIILPHKPDKKFAFNLARSFYTELLSAGVKIYEYEPGFVHSKVFISDDEKAVVGTINLDYRSLFLHFECAVYMYRTECIADIRKDYDDTLLKCIPVTKEYYYKLALGKRLAGRIMRLFAPLL